MFWRYKSTFGQEENSRVWAHKSRELATECDYFNMAWLPWDPVAARQLKAEESPSQWLSNFSSSFGQSRSSGYNPQASVLVLIWHGWGMEWSVSDMQLHSYKSCIFKTMLKCSMSKQPRQKVIYTLKLVLNFKIFKRQSICMFQVLKCILKVQAELSQPLSHLTHFISSTSYPWD